MLAVVEEKEGRLPPQRLDRCVEEGSVLFFASPERSRNGGGNQIGISNGRQVDEPRATRALLGCARSRLDCEASFPDTSGADESHEVRARKRLQRGGD
jgi:hypothetical protein